MSPGISGRENAVIRQNQVMRSVLKDVSENKIVYTTMLGTKLLKDIETDMDIKFLTAMYETYKKKTGWVIDIIIFGQ
jgi:hypothetical protein